MLMEKAKSREFWRLVRTDSVYDELLLQIKSTYQDARWDEIPCLNYKPRMRFYGDGDRSEFEKPYFRRRTYLSTASFLALIYPEEQKYLDEVQECLWAISCEYSWCLPAHCDGTLEDDLHRIDLFSAETGFTLAEICYVLEDRLDALVLNRARSEVRSRVIDNFVDRHFGWENDKANWSAVCAGNVGGAMMYLSPDIFQQQLPRLLEDMQTFMSGFPDDGTCMEGFSYWHYGFGNFLWFADLLYQYTDGKYDLLAWDKAEAVAGYAQRSFLTGGSTVSNADGTASGKADRAMISYLHRRFPETVQLLPKSHTVYSKGNVTWMQTLRNLLYADHSADNVEFRLLDVYLPSAHQAILHRKDYSLAAKAGHNHEFHNHNDVGSFILSTDKGQIFCDLGAGLYTRQYFRNGTRYGIFCNSSLSHSVPIINGKPQLYGDAFLGTLTQQGDRIDIDFSDAYGQEKFSKLHRTFTCTNSHIILTDSFMPDYDALTERFVTTRRPDTFADYIIVDGVKLSFDAGNMTLRISEETHYTHNASLPPETVYCIDFELKPGLCKVTFTIDILEE